MNIHHSLFWALMLYESEQGHPWKQPRTFLNAVDHSTVTRGFKKFHLGYKNLDDQEMSSKSTNIDPKAIFQAIKANQTRSTQRVSGELNISQFTKVRYLHELNKSNESSANCALHYPNIAKLLTQLNIYPHIFWPQHLGLIFTSK